MKTKLPVISHCCIAAIGLASIAMVGTALAQTPTHGAKTAMLNKDDASAGKGGKLSAKDKTFMMNAAKGGQMEVAWGHVAADNSKNADVKKFGNRMVTDHTKANDELMNLAKEKGVTLPQEKMKGKWKSDKDYVDMMVQDHEKDLAEFQDQAKNGSDADLKKFADKTSKIVQKHLTMVKEIQGKLK